MGAMTWSLSAAISMCVLLFPAVTGNWVFELNIQNYTNERHASYLSTLNQYACCDCPAGVACSASTLSALGHICTDRDCYNRFLICVDGKCIYSESTNAGDDLTFTNKIVNLDNPLKFEGNSQGPFTVSVVIYDDIALQEEAATHKYIDEIVVSNIELSQSESFSPAQSYNGDKGIAMMSFSYRIQCADGYSGSDCSTPPEVQTCSTMTTVCNGVSTERVVVTETVTCGSSIATTVSASVSNRNRETTTSPTSTASSAVRGISDRSCKDDMSNFLIPVIIVIVILLLIIITIAVIFVIVMYMIKRRQEKLSFKTNTYEMKK